MRYYRPYRFRITIWHAIAALLLLVYGLCTQSCRDQYPLDPEPCDASRIEGRWQKVSSPFWHYDFHAPQLRQWIEVAGTVVVEQVYIYGTRNDTLWASGDGGDRVWRVCFVGDTLAEVVDVSGVLQMPAFYLRRE